RAVVGGRVHSTLERPSPVHPASDGRCPRRPCADGPIARQRPLCEIFDNVRADRHLSFGPSQMPNTRSSPWERAVPAGLAALLLLLTAAVGAVAEPPAGPAGAPVGSDNWQQWWVPITTPATDDRVFLLETVIYRPGGDGPFPLHPR